MSEKWHIYIITHRHLKIQILPPQDKPWTHHRVKPQEGSISSMRAANAAFFSLQIPTRTTPSLPLWCLLLHQLHFSFRLLGPVALSSFLHPDRTWALKRHQTQRMSDPAEESSVTRLCQISLVLAPSARSPSVEKKSSISFSRSRLRFSASCRARSEFRSLISSMRCFFFSCSISCSRRSICAHRVALDSSNLKEVQTETKVIQAHL